MADNNQAIKLNPKNANAYKGPEVLLAAKTYGSVFYDKLSPSIARGKW